MHKYSIKIVIEREDGSCKTIFSLPDSSFIAVSAYRSIQLTKIKIATNIKIKQELQLKQANATPSDGATHTATANDTANDIATPNINGSIANMVSLTNANDETDLQVYIGSHRKLPVGFNSTRLPLLSLSLSLSLSPI